MHTSDAAWEGDAAQPVARSWKRGITAWHQVANHCNRLQVGRNMVATWLQLGFQPVVTGNDSVGTGGVLITVAT